MADSSSQSKLCTDMFSKSKPVVKHKHCDVKLGKLYEMAQTDATY